MHIDETVPRRAFEDGQPKVFVTRISAAGKTLAGTPRIHQIKELEPDNRARLIEPVYANVPDAIDLLRFG